MSDAMEEIAHEATHEASHGNRNAKLIGLLISILALFLAVSEMLGKSAQTHALALNIEASDTWNFFQAKTIRQTMLRTNMENLKLQTDVSKPEVEKQMSTWQATIDRWESEPSTNEGRKELIKKAKEIEAKRDGYLEQYHAYEFASLLIQLGIVLSSVTLLTSIMWFSAGSIGLGLGGLAVLVGAYTKAHFLLALLH
jgi:Domain of unknown function (DUF4337)